MIPRVVTTTWDHATYFSTFLTYQYILIFFQLMQVATAYRRNLPSVVVPDCAATASTLTITMSRRVPAAMVWTMAALMVPRKRF